MGGCPERHIYTQNAKQYMGGFFVRLLCNVYFVHRGPFAGAVLLAVSGKTQLGCLICIPRKLALLSYSDAFCMSVEAFDLSQANNIVGTFGQFVLIVFDNTR